MQEELTFIKSQIIGLDHFIDTPFGKRLILYLDYTASGRNLLFIENYLLEVEKDYANTHTEDDESGWITTKRVHEAEGIIKKAVNGNEDYHLIFTGTGTTGSIQKLMEILGLYIPPTFKKIFRDINECVKKCGIKKPVVFVGPYEHHSNLVTWREGFCDVIPIRLDKEGAFSTEDFIKKLNDPRWEGCLKIASISAASNVTGVKTDVYEIAKIAHENNCLIFFDFAACAPYVPININKDKETFFDGIYFSPHKFLGGPGTGGVLIFHEKIYDKTLPPTFGGGGTVTYVNEIEHDFVDSIDEREKAGTPGILQILRTALAIEVKDYVGTDYIMKMEQKHLAYCCERWSYHPEIMILGPRERENRIGIISYNIKHRDRYFHPKFISRLLNDLFGIQSRAGCSCAGPYGHYLLGIGLDVSNKYRKITQKGYSGLKPGWGRINLHYTLDETDLDFILNAIEFIAQYGERFLSLYEFNVYTGDWHYIGFDRNIPEFSLKEAVKCKERILINKIIDRKKLYREYIQKATEAAEKLPEDVTFVKLDDELEKLCYFYLAKLKGDKK